MRLARANGVTPRAGSRISGTPLFSLPTTTSAQGPRNAPPRTPRQDLAPIAAMATAAAVTETLRVGCRVFCIDYHVPAVLAKEAATLDLLSDGRLELGIGAGWSGVEYAAMGLTFDPPGRRITKLEEVIALVKAHFSGDEIDCAGEFVNVSGYAGTPRPVQRPHPPIMVGGGGPRVLSLAAREADIVSISNVPFVARNEAGLTPHKEARRRMGLVYAAARRRAASGYDDLDIESSPYFTEITDDPDGGVGEGGIRDGSLSRDSSRSPERAHRFCRRRRRDPPDAS